MSDVGDHVDGQENVEDDLPLPKWADPRDDDDLYMSPPDGEEDFFSMEVIKHWEYTPEGADEPYTLLVKKHSESHYCGYVQVRRAVTNHDDDHEARDVDVPGGLTYGLDERGFVGFDTNHAYYVNVDGDGSFLPNTMWGRMGILPRDEMTHVDPAWTIAETEQLADRLCSRDY